MMKTDFPDGVLKEANDISVDKTYLGTLEQTEGITIDDVNSRDIDDGFLLETDSDGWVLSVSVADAASVIKKDSPVYNFAKLAVHTQYLPDRKKPMLPPALSENKLSLLENKLRPAVTFIITISSNLEITDLKIKKTAFKNRRKLSYQLTDEILAREKPDKEFGHLAECYHLANLLLEKRRENGALVIYDFIRGMFTNEEGQIIINRNNRLHMANIIVQEFMILTNSTAAEYLIKRNRQLVLRNHTAKSTTPPRDEIYSQYLLAKTNPNTIDTLKKRIELWFEKAEYSTKLRGHYGLNLPAYTHLTSPLRRFPDLVNQYIINSFISGKRTPYSKDNLNKIALRINRNIQKIRRSKSNHLKEKAVREMLDIAESPEPETFELLDSKKFRTILHHSCIAGNIGSGLLKETEKRILSGNAGPEHLVCLLFELKKENIHFNKLFNLAFEFLKSKPEFARSIINIAEQKKYLNGIKSETKRLNGGFAYIISVIKNNVQYSSPSVQIKNSRRNSVYSETFNFLKNYLENRLVPLTEMKLHESTIKKSDNKIKDKQGSETVISKKEKYAAKVNYTGKLIEVCMKNKMLSLPEFVYNQSGQPNSPVFDCKCTVKSGAVIFETESSAGRKLAAKHLASKEMKEKLRKYLDEYKERQVKQENTVYIKEKQSDKEVINNYVGILENISVRYNNFSSPEYNFTEEITDEGYLHTCDCKISFNNHLYSAGDTRKSKKNAKQAAAYKLIKSLSEKNIIGKNLKGEYEVLKSAGWKQDLILNYSGTLNKITLMHNNFSEPEYEFLISETQNRPEITYRCRLLADNREIITEYTSNKKSISKQKTAFLMIKKLLEGFAEEIHKTQNVNENINLYFSKLKEKLKPENHNNFRYLLFRWLYPKNPFFSCLSQLCFDNSDIEIITTEKSVVEAVSKSEKILIGYLKDDAHSQTVIDTG
ncbi:MAG: RNB domain-containing ribonuclease [Ignavibacteria bacterium]|nr:RNB domain-containing ribonuclease [Ignavibacteria bacterium]